MKTSFIMEIITEFFLKRLHLEKKTVVDKIYIKTNYLRLTT